MAEHLNKQTFLEKVFNYEKNQDWKFEGEIPAVVDFWAPWCGPCKMVAPEVAKLAIEVAGRLLVAKVNTEASPSLAQQFGISGIPTFIVFRDGGELARQSGAMSASQLKNFVSRAL